MSTLFVSDLDGTLFNSNAEISQYTTDIINNLTNQGVSFTFATARSERSAFRMTESINITAPCVLMNGVIIYELNKEYGKYVKYHQIPRNIALQISDMFNQHGIIGNMYIIHNDNLISYSQQDSNESLNDIIVKYDHDSPIYFTANDDYDVLLPLKNDIEKTDKISFAFYEDTYTKKWFLEIFSENASKSNGIKFLRENYGFDKIVCFGDNLNDIPMFKEADICVAVENAKPELKKIADFMTLSNDNNGVAVWLEKNYKIYTDK